MVQEFSIHWFARLAMALPSALFAWLFYFFVSPANRTDEAIPYVLILFALFFCATILTFTGRVKIDDTGIRFENFYPFPARLFKWDDISSVQANIVSNIPRTFVLGLRNTQQRIWGPYTLGPWVKNYKTLLREITERVPPNTTIHPEILDIVKTGSERTRQETAQAIYVKQQARYPSLPK